MYSLGREYLRDFVRSVNVDEFDQRRLVLNETRENEPSGERRCTSTKRYIISRIQRLPSVARVRHDDFGPKVAEHERHRNKENSSPKASPG